MPIDWDLAVKDQEPYNRTANIPATTCAYLNTEWNIFFTETARRLNSAKNKRWISVDLDEGFFAIIIVYILLKDQLSPKFVSERISQKLQCHPNSFVWQISVFCNCRIKMNTLLRKKTVKNYHQSFAVWKAFYIFLAQQGVFVSVIGSCGSWCFKAWTKFYFSSSTIAWNREFVSIAKP